MSQTTVTSLLPRMVEVLFHMNLKHITCCFFERNSENDGSHDALGWPTEKGGAKWGH